MVSESIVDVFLNFSSKHYLGSLMVFSANGEPIGLPLSDKIIESPSQHERAIPSKIQILDPNSISSSELQKICCEADLPYTWIKDVSPLYLTPCERKRFSVREALDRFYSSLTPASRKVYKSRIEGLIRKGYIDPKEKLDPFATRTVKKLSQTLGWRKTKGSRDSARFAINAFLKFINLGKSDKKYKIAPSHFSYQKFQQCHLRLKAIGRDMLREVQLTSQIRKIKRKKKVTIGVHSLATSTALKLPTFQSGEKPLTKPSKAWFANLKDEDFHFLHQNLRKVNPKCAAVAHIIWYFNKRKVPLTLKEALKLKSGQVDLYGNHLSFELRKQNYLQMIYAWVPNDLIQSLEGWLGNPWEYVFATKKGNCIKETHFIVE